MCESIVILTRTYFRDGDILNKNLCSTLNIFVNNEKYKFGVILDDESEEDHKLGDYLINNKIIDYIYYEPLPNNHRDLFQALAYPNMSWGYDRQQWSTFYMDTFVKENVVGVVDSDSTFTSYLTNEDIFTETGKIKLKGIKHGSPYINDAVALKFDTVFNLMVTNIMPMFFWKETFQNFRNYISQIWGMSFDEAYKIFSIKPYCQFDILANYAMKFESDKYEFIDVKSNDNKKFVVAQNGCPTSRDTLCGLVKSFKISEDDLMNNNIIIKKSTLSYFGSCVDTNVNYESIINDTRHANNFSHFCNNPCSLEEIDEHYKNVYRDINNLSENKKYELNNKIIYFLKNEFNNIIIKG